MWGTNKEVPAQLFNLAKDPMEYNNLMNTTAGKALAVPMDKLLKVRMLVLLLLVLLVLPLLFLRS